MKQEVYLIDGSAYVYRAFHGVKSLANSKGMPTNAVFGFINILQRLLREKKPHYLAVAFDSRGEVFRHQMYPEYKANRPPMPEDLAVQVPYIHDFIRHSRILCLEQPGIEADDLIASAARQLNRQGYRVVVVSGDKDLLQLVGESVVMWDPMNDRLMDEAAVTARYQVAPARLLELFALVGDSADNVPGVPGVGPKSGAKLIAEFGSLEQLYANLDTMKPSKMKERLVEHRDAAFLSRDLIRLQDDAKIPEAVEQYLLQPADELQLAALYTELEFSRFLQQLDTSEKVATDSFTCITSEEELEQVVNGLLARKLVVLDTETTSLNARDARLVGLSLCSDLDRAWYVPLGHLDEKGDRVADQLDDEAARRLLTPLLQSPTIMKIGHNLKYDYTVLHQQWGLDLAGQLADTMIAAHLLEVSSQSLKLDDLCRERGLRLTPFTEVVGQDTREDCFAYVDPQNACNYSCEDVYGTLVLWREFVEKLQERGQEDLFYRLEMALLVILAEMEMRGICIDERLLHELSGEFRQKLADIEQRIYTVAGQTFNINSPRQLAHILFEELQLPHGRKTKTGYSTDVKVLEKLAAKHELPALILEYRTLAKLQSTYVEKLALLRDRQTGRIHTSFNQAVTSTGRLSSSNPNLQNIPIRGEEGSRIRQAFVPAPGQLFISADYSQIDLRVLAHYSKDQALKEAFQAGDDIHARTAAQIFGVSPLLVSADMRRVAKSINFGIVYGMSSFGLSSQLGISRKEAQTFIDRYFQLYSGVKRYMEETVVQARKDGYVTTLLARRRAVPEINAANRVQREFAERTAINTPIQGTAADIIKLAMLKVEAALRQGGVPAALLLQIHDELVFEIAGERVDEAREVVREAMESALELDVPLVVNIEVGTSLAK
ncbi:MAG: DNA polymerase I [Desulfopila sp.]